MPCEQTLDQVTIVIVIVQIRVSVQIYGGLPTIFLHTAFVHKNKAIYTPQIS